MVDYSLGPVVGVLVYARDVVVVRKGRKNDPPIVDRGVIAHWSRPSRLRLAFVAANSPVHFKTMLTLTYPKDFPSDGKCVKANLNTFLIWLGRECRRPEYLWFLEFQRRGAPHFHIVIDWSLPRRPELVSAFRWRVASSWYRFVGSHDEKHLGAGTSVERIRKPDGAARYALRYAAKMYQKNVPTAYRDVGRFWGCSRNVVPERPSMVQCTEDDIRGIIEGMKFSPPETRELYHVLFGVADRFREHLSPMSDNISPYCQLDNKVEP